MANTNSRMSQTKAPYEKRLYWGAGLSHLLILWLNSTKGTARNKRVERLLDLIDRYEAALAQYGAQNAVGGQIWWEGRVIKGGSRLEHPFGDKEVEQAADAVAHEFRKYTFRAELAYGYGNRLLFDWVPAKPKWRSTADRIGGPSPKETHFVFTETHAVARIVELCHEGVIDRVRLCTCGMWFYAKFSHMKFHTMKCQQRVYRDDPAWRAYRREYMKRNRALHATQFFRSTREPIRPRKKGE